MEEDGTVRRQTREERTCLHCEGGVDDEEHFLWACTTHDGIREELFQKLEVHNKPDMILALRTPANRRPVHAIKWVMQYMGLLSWPGIAGKALRTEGNEEGGDEEGVEEEGSKSKCCTLY